MITRTAQATRNPQARLEHMVARAVSKLSDVDRSLMLAVTQKMITLARMKGQLQDSSETH
jgi:hypothetical protein